VVRSTCCRGVDFGIQQEKYCRKNKNGSRYFGSCRRKNGSCGGQLYSVQFTSNGTVEALRDLQFMSD
jgi:hypothetical protein